MLPDPADVQLGVTVTRAQHVADLRFGFAPLPPTAPGYLPAADAQALMLPGLASPAAEPAPGVQYIGSCAPGQRFVIRVPDGWNGSLVIAGAPSTRSEFSNDLVWGDFALARGYAFAASNKGVAVNVMLEVAADLADRRDVYPVPFDSGGLLTQGLALRFGVLSPQRIPVDDWNAEFLTLVRFSRELLAQRHAPPARVYAVGLSNGGSQVRTLLERHPELIDGGVEWGSVYWSPERNLLDELPAFLREMPAYIGSGFRDAAIVDRLVERGFPADVVQDDPAHPSLYVDYYSNVPPFYADLTLFVYALLIDPEAHASYDVPACIADPHDPARLPARCNGNGLAVPANRAAYVPSAAARKTIAGFAHSGNIGKPLVSIAGTCDVFISPANHALTYARAVARAGRSALHELFLVEGGTHLDTFAAFGYGLQAQAPFAWAAFDRLVRTVENDGGALGGAIRTVRMPSEIA
jgi:alpha-beta hydrolase superfamily lysophospholipase